LKTALDLAEPEGYIRVFVDEGAPIEELLRSSGAASEYVRRLLATMPADHKELSDRELQVLRLLATALTGPQIARELYISLNTMRTHTKNIFEKLEATSRTEAVRRASELGLL
jgi:LuxR family maltose regulon positive regulatory protein